MKTDDAVYTGLPLTLSRKDFCRISGLHRNTVNRLVARGMLQTVRIGRYRRYLKVNLVNLTKPTNT